MRRDPRAYLWDALDAARNVETFVQGRSFEEFAGDLLLRSAVERQLEIVGEALNQLSRTVPEIAARIPELPRIVAFRNLLVHGYAVVNHETVWRTIQEKLPELRTVLSREMDALGED